jgi:beta-glucanase (GH16 family)
VPVFASGFALIDPDTPQSAYTKPSWMDNGEMELVFSDEFNVDDRTFYPGDDPFWEAVDLHYWVRIARAYMLFLADRSRVQPTGNVEWYDPAAVTTGGGSLAITFSATPEHKLQYRGGPSPPLLFPTPSAYSRARQA